ncbi:hypothetical protein KQI11_05800 [Acetanaerobacterium sp. MSJ-12]|uniref:hypothetical protein n=1 Tax=Acetanaerobacterium sp. MSJ-12 TaxID=2841535 RepID=UPI001C0F0EC6|nr:hypothetical protein [Acetanaerobacterium sp. MSJ-12]MBU5419632.1 hypothetical protein [Acetanaerobacterium sp. MSJ-12]
MCDVCRQTTCPSGCPNAPEWAPPECDLCDNEARWEYEGERLCTRCLVESVTEDAEFEEMIAFVSESRDQWHNFLDFLLDSGELGAETLRGTRFDWPSAVREYCSGNEDFFEYLDYNQKVHYKELDD